MCIRDRYFGPFPNSVAVRESIQLLQKVFKLRTCENTVFANRSRPCLQHQIERCTAPCVGLISDDDYRNDVHQAALFLQGKTNEVINALGEQMNTAATNQEYEMAVVFRDRMQALRQVQAKQFVSDFNVSDADVIACAELQGQHCINLVMIRGGRHLGDRSYMPKNSDGETLKASTEAFLAQHYVAQKMCIRDRYPTAHVHGLTLSTKQIDYIDSLKLTSNSVELRAWQNYSPPEHKFDAITCIGCLEHFATYEDSAEGRQRDIYKNFFDWCLSVTTPEAQIGLQTIVTVSYTHLDVYKRQICSQAWALIAWLSEKLA